MGTGFSVDPSEYRAAANVIEGYGAMQADHGTTLAAGTSTPLSGSGSGIGGAISKIAQGTLQKIVTDVTSTTKGFADDTATGLRMQADSVEQLETDLAGRAKSVLSDAQSPLLSGGYPMGGMSTTLNSPMTMDAPLGGSGPSGAGRSGAGTIGQQVSQDSSTPPFGQMRGGTGAAAGAGTADERGQRPNYLKSKTELTRDDSDRARAAVDRHLQECGTAPIPLDPSRLVCAKCGSILEIDDVQAFSG